MKSSDVVQFMRSVLEEAGYEIEENLDDPGWTWRHGTAECEKALSTMDEVVQEAWASAAAYVNDVLGGHIPDERWDAMSVAQQSKMILLCFDDEDDDEDATMANGLFAAIQENDLLRVTLAELGRNIEVGDSATAVATWQRAKHEHNLGATV